jgi:biotin operon repressor
MIDRFKQSGARTDRPQATLRAAPNVSFVSIAQALIVADYGSFRRAARALGVQRSAISRRVQALENNLGVSLFERQTSGLRLTSAGRRFLERTRLAIDEIESAVRHAATAGRGAEGIIRVGLATPISFFLADLLKDFRAEHMRFSLISAVGRRADISPGSWIEVSMSSLRRSFQTRQTSMSYLLERAHFCRHAGSARV